MHKIVGALPKIEFVPLCSSGKQMFSMQSWKTQLDQNKYVYYCKCIFMIYFNSDSFCECGQRT